MWERNTSCLLGACSIQGLNLHPRHEPWQGNKLVSFRFAGQCPTEPHQSGLASFFSILGMCVVWAMFPTTHSLLCVYSMCHCIVAMTQLREILMHKIIFWFLHLSLSKTHLLRSINQMSRLICPQYGTFIFWEESAQFEHLSGVVPNPFVNQLKMSITGKWKLTGKERKTQSRVQVILSIVPTYLGL